MPGNTVNISRQEFEQAKTEINLLIKNMHKCMEKSTIRRNPAEGSHKMLRVMKLSVFFLVLVFNAGWMNPAYSQNTQLTLNLKNKTLKEVFNEIEKNSEYKFFYNNNAVDLTKKVDISVKEKAIGEILDILLKGSTTKYRITDRQIILYTAGNEKSLDNQQITDAENVTGKVLDENGEPLTGVSVYIKGSTGGTITDINGSFTIKVPSSASLVFRYTGYTSQETKLNGQKTLAIRMTEDTQLIDEVVVVGFGKQKKESVIGAIQTMSPSDMKLPTTNLTNNFAGRIAGVISVQKTGEPGADGSNFWIRGVGTFAGGSAQTPLILIDGTESSSYDLNALAPEVIESFSILKDATATALYGSRGANGVMLITTKSGKSGKPSINVRAEGRMSMPTQIPKLADGVTFMKMFNEAILTRTSDGTPQFTQDQIQGVIEKRNPYLFPDVNWYDALFNDVAYTQAANMNVSGGSAKMDYFISATINNDMGLLKEAPENPFKNNIQNLRYSFQSNVNTYVTSTTRIGVKLNVQVQDYKGPYNDIDYIFQRVMMAQPSYFPIKYPQIAGTDYTAYGNKSGGAQLNRYPNPYAEMAAGIDEMFRTTTMAAFNVDQNLMFITPGLSFKGMFSLKNFGSTTTTRYNTPYYFEADPNNIQQDPETGAYSYTLKPVNTDGTNSVTASNSFTGDRLINLTASVDYQRKFAKLHDISAQLIYLQRGLYKNNPSSSDYNAALGELNQGFAGRLTYDFDKRYFAEFNFGYNGSDNFAKGKRFGFFPSYAVGYIISNEEFFNPLAGIVSLLKLRASYGTVGNSYSPIRFPGYTNVNMAGGGYGFGENFAQTTKGAIVTSYGNENATWEVAKKTNLGLELGLFEQKLMLITDWFYEDRDQIIMRRVNVPSTLGIGNANPYANIGRVSNTGVDMSLVYNHAITPDLILSVRGNMTFAVNKVLAKDEPYYKWDYQYEKGGALNRVGPAYMALGLFKDQEDVDTSPSQVAIMPNIKPGDIKYKDLNDDNVINEYDRTYVGNPYIPQVVYGFGASLKYKKWDCSLFFQGAAKVSIYLDDIHPFDIYHKNVLQFVADDYWSESNPNPNAKYPRLSHTVDNTNTHQTSSFWLRDGSFIRLKNAELGYSFDRFRAYVSGSNLLVFSPFKYWDPEIGGGSNSGNGLVYPLQKVVNLGIQFNF